MIAPAEQWLASFAAETSAQNLLIWMTLLLVGTLLFFMLRDISIRLRRLEKRL